jgi:16S rRNA G966 N2-methylase RsmD
LQTKLQAHAVQVLRGDGIGALKQLAPASTNLIFLDPPFDAKLYDAALQAAARALASGGYVYLEAPSAWSEEQLMPLGLTLRRHLKAGAVHAHLLTKETA